MRKEGRKWERERIRQEEEGERGRRCGMREGQREEREENEQPRTMGLLTHQPTSTQW